MEGGGRSHCTLRQIDEKPREKKQRVYAGEGGG